MDRAAISGDADRHAAVAVRPQPGRSASWSPSLARVDRRTTRISTAATANGTSRKRPTSFSVGVRASYWPRQFGHSASDRAGQHATAAAASATGVAVRVIAPR